MNVWNQHEITRADLTLAKRYIDYYSAHESQTQSLVDRAADYFGRAYLVSLNVKRAYRQKNPILRPFTERDAV